MIENGQKIIDAGNAIAEANALLALSKNCENALSLSSEERKANGYSLVLNVASKNDFLPGRMLVGGPLGVEDALLKAIAATLKEAAGKLLNFADISAQEAFKPVVEPEFGASQMEF